MDLTTFRQEFYPTPWTWEITPGDRVCLHLYDAAGNLLFEWTGPRKQFEHERPDIIFERIVRCVNMEGWLTAAQSHETEHDDAASSWMTPTILETLGFRFKEGHSMQGIVAETPCNILFLDIDGVLNGLATKPSECFQQIDPRCARNLNRVLEATKAKIVLSSSWRYLVLGGEMTIHGFGAMLRSHGITAEVAGTTRAEEDGEDRLWQIADWLKSPAPIRIRRYCILDDDPRAFGGRPGVLVNGAVGLTERDAEEAIAILNQPAAT